MFLLRPAHLSDLEGILEIARFLDSANLPADEHLLAKRLKRSEHAFAEKGLPSPDREYQLVLLDTSDRVVGTSAILSEHGTPGMPHLYLRVRNEERRADSVNVSIQHRTFQLEAERDGPSELCSLVLHPTVRRCPGWPGQLLSWGRFAFMAMHPNCFKERILAEMRPSFDTEGHQAFWHAFGERFTGMSYDEADRRSAADKRFILDLFPSTPFYASLLDDEAVAELGQVHEEARPALRLLERAGFYWIGQIDPFDAAPYYGAAVTDVVPITRTRQVRVGSGAPSEDASVWIASSEEQGEFRAVATRAELVGDWGRLPKEARERLDVIDGDDLVLTPLPDRGEARGS